MTELGPLGPMGMDVAMGSIKALPQAVCGVWSVDGSGSGVTFPLRSPLIKELTFYKVQVCEHGTGVDLPKAISSFPIFLISH
jgi:hypothetical protein